MDLRFNQTARFTEWVAAENLLREPFVVVDIGVQGGENPRWHRLRDHLVVHGFDAIKEVVEDLRAQNASRPNLHYHWIAAGNEDGEREFFVNRNDPCSSSMYAQGADRFDSGRTDETRLVKVRKLDTLLEEGIIPKADFLKVDVEGFEKEVFAGARKLLDAGVLGIETESNFGVSPGYPGSHFGTVLEQLIEHKLLVFDLNFNRVPRAAFQRALQRESLSPVTDNESVGKVSTLVVLFCRDLIDEADAPQNYAAPQQAVTVDQIIKLMVILELHGLNDVAIDMAERFRDRIRDRLDVDHAIHLLADPSCRLTRQEALNTAQKLIGPDTRLARDIRFVERMRRMLERVRGMPFRFARRVLGIPRRVAGAALRTASRLVRMLPPSVGDRLRSAYRSRLRSAGGPSGNGPSV